VTGLELRVGHWHERVKRRRCRRRPCDLEVCSKDGAAGVHAAGACKMLRRPQLSNLTGHCLADVAAKTDPAVHEWRTPHGSEPIELAHPDPSAVTKPAAAPMAGHKSDDWRELEPLARAVHRTSRRCLTVGCLARAVCPSCSSRRLLAVRIRGLPHKTGSERLIDPSPRLSRSTRPAFAGC
jgi:hypothetical protein